MNIFNLPDLGEGLPDAEIHEWFVKEGDTVKADQPIVAMETAKAVVDVPAPQDGVIAKLYGIAGDILKTGSPLVAFEASETERVDKGTVVGNLEESHDISEDIFTIGSGSPSNRSKATPVVRVLAKKLGVNLTLLSGSGEHGMITRMDVENAAAKQIELPAGFEALRGVRRTMLTSMVQSHRDVVPVTIFDDADINNWRQTEDITVRLIQALARACAVEPALNAWFDTLHNARKCYKEMHVGLAMDTEEGLFVPVIHNAENLAADELRQHINNYKITVRERRVPTDKLKGATITLSNFGKFAGRYASPIIVPPTVAILAVGRLYDTPVVASGEVTTHRMLPLSLSFDHRAVTGGEATRFLGSVIESLQANGSF